MHHAWLLTGPPGIGKATLAFRFARRLLAGRPDRTRRWRWTSAAAGVPARGRRVARRPADGRAANGTTRRKRLRGEIVVDDVRRVTEFLHLTPAEGGWRVVVVDGAEDLNRNAANALLKVLEEPPPRAVLLLVCSAAGRLLPTIRSRCRRLRLAALDDAAMADLLARYLPDRRRPSAAGWSTLGEGSIGRALALAEGGGVGGRRPGGRRCSSALPDLPAKRAHEVADALGRDEDAFSLFMDLLRAGLGRGGARGGARAGGPGSGTVGRRAAPCRLG